MGQAPLRPRDGDGTYRPFARGRTPVRSSEPITKLRDLAPSSAPTFADIRGEKERELARRAAAGDEQAITTLLIAHEPFIIKTSLSFATFAEDIEGAIQSGRMGFMRALKDWDPTKGAITTYSWHWIGAYVGRYIADCEGDIPMPAHALAAGIEAEMKGAETPEEAVALTDKPAARFALIARHRSQRLDAPIGDEEGRTLADVIADGAAAQDARLAAEEAQARRAAILDDALAGMPPREALILRQRRLLAEPLTLEAIGEELGITKERVRQIEVMAMARLRRRLLGRVDDEDAEALWGGWRDDDDPPADEDLKIVKTRRQHPSLVAPKESAPPREQPKPARRGVILPPKKASPRTPASSPPPKKTAARLAIEEILARRPLSPPGGRRILFASDSATAPTTPASPPSPPVQVRPSPPSPKRVRPRPPRPVIVPSTEARRKAWEEILKVAKATGASEGWAAKVYEVRFGEKYSEAR